jgi:hypothetical protein
MNSRLQRTQPTDGRPAWQARRGSTWHKLTRPGRFIHYAELRKLPIEHANHLAGGIDNGGHRLSPEDR